MRRLLFTLLAAAPFLVSAPSAGAHPAPFSYLNLRLTPGGLSGTLVIHDFDAAHELNLASPYFLLDPQGAARYRDALLAVLSPRISLRLDGRPAQIAWGVIDTAPERLSLELAFTVPGRRPGQVQLRAALFPYDPTHQTFVNVYEEGVLAQQAILDAHRSTADYYSGTPQGRLAVVKTFVLSGTEHILIGPDHVLFLVGLLLLGGSMMRLIGIVTAFTIGHTITLSLAALDLLSPPARLVEPLIALTIVVVGADNLMMLRNQGGKTHSVDIRAWLAAGFGLIHGFGFASVLKEFGLPQAALGFSLFAFNLGVEVGQLAIVSVVAGSLALLTRQSLKWASRVAHGGSIAVILAGLYWFVLRTFFPGG